MKSQRKMLYILFGALLLLANKQSACAEELPHYFPEGVITTTDSFKQLQEYDRYLKATRPRLNGNSPSIAGSDSIRVVTDLDSTSSAINRDKPTKMVLVFDHYVRMNDGKIRVTYPGKQEVITQEQFAVVAKDFEGLAKRAIALNVAYYKDFADLAVKSRAEKLGIPEKDFRQLLDKPIPGYKHKITFRELHSLPRPMRESDFVPRELHLGYTPQNVFGMAWLNTGVIYYSPQARIRDYLVGSPGVLQHEMVHGNINLQKFPASVGFDVELQASFPEMLYPENQLDLFFHSYSGVVRELSRIYFGFNWKQVRKEVFQYDLGGNLVIDEERYRAYFEKTQQIKAELLKFYREKVVPEFYSDTVYWSGMNEKRKDQNSILRIVMAAYYDPTILGGREKTLKWLDARRELILDMARVAYRKSGTPTEGSTDSNKTRLPAFIQNNHQALLTPQEIKRIEDYFRNNPAAREQVLNLSVNELIDLFLKLKRGTPPGGAR